jgi:surfeit locus 1 family protein
VTAPTTRRPISLTPRGILATIFVFAVSAGCVRLGFWQLDRMRQRAAINAALESRLAGDPVVLDQAPRDTSGWLFRRVTIRGRFDGQRSIVLPGHSLRGAPGVHLLTPLRLDNDAAVNGGAAVLANRGWLPAADGATVDLDAYAADSEVVATGLVVPFPTGPVTRRGTAATASSSDGGFRRVWFAMDEAALRRQFPYELGQIQVQLLPDDSAAELPVRIPVPALDPGPHLGYAIQWFSFAVIGVVGWLVLFLKSGVARVPRPRR